MDPHSSRRARGTPFGYDTKPMMNEGEYEVPYSYESPPGQHLLPPNRGMDLPPGPEPPDNLGMPYMMSAQRHGYHPSNYRDNRLPSTYRQTLRDPHAAAGPPSGSGVSSYKILCITNINSKIDDSSVKNALMSDFSRFGDISVSICHDSGERLAYIYFRSYEEARDARLTKTKSIFFDRPIDIEPIYEPDNSPTDCTPPPPSYPPAMMPQHVGVYSPRSRRSITPPDFHYDMNGPILDHRRRVMPPVMPHHAPSPPMPMNQRPISPYDYPPPHAMEYGSHGPSPSVMDSSLMVPPYNRRDPYAAHYMPANHMSPYSSPPHEPYRSPYPPSHHYATPSPYSIGGPIPPPPSSRPERDRLYPDSRYMDPRSPRGADPYHPEHGGLPVPPPHSYHSSSRSSGHHRASPLNLPTSRPEPSQSNVPAAYRHRSAAGSPPYRPPPRQSQARPDPPMRFMSREYRRERYGTGGAGAEPHGGDQENGRPSRVLLVDNIDSSKTEADLRDMFEPLGIIEELEVKRITPDTSSALIRFSSMDGAYKAKSANNGRYIGNSKCNIYYGKVSASRRLWIGGLSSSTTVRSLEDECSKYGELINMEYTSGRPYSYVEFETPNQAQFAAYHLRSSLIPAPDRKVRIEFVDPERSEKMSRHDANSQTSETKSRTTIEFWASNEPDISPSSFVARKRSPSPVESSAKRICPVNDLPPGANTFKHERLIAAAAAKARSSSSTTSGQQPGEKTVELPVVQVEHNNTNNRLGNGDLETNTSHSMSEHTDDSEPSYETPSLEMLSQCSSIREIVSCCPVSWPSLIVLRNFTFPSKIYLCSGRREVVDRYLARAIGANDGQSLYPLLRITQRWRMQPQPKLEEVKRRMQSGNLGMLIITSRSDKQPVETRNSASKTGSTGRDLQKLLHNGDKSSKIEKTVTSVEAENSQISNSPGKSSRMTTSGNGISNESTTTLNDSAASGNPSESDNSMAASSVMPGGPTTPQHNQTASTNSSSQSRPLRNLISYLEQKDAAGVISLNASLNTTSTGCQQAGSDANPKLLYTFPPGEFAKNLIKRMASNLSGEFTREEFLLGVIVGGSMEAKM